jgi:hypothetical protein
MNTMALTVGRHGWDRRRLIELLWEVGGDLA